MMIMDNDTLREGINGFVTSLFATKNTNVEIP